MTESVVLCPDCQEELFKTKKRYVCDECDFTCLIDELETEIESWDKVLYLDDKLWLHEVCSESPYLIAHEYSRLRSLLGEKKFFGLLLQIKDFVEVLLKFHVVLEVKKQGSKGLYAELLAKPLSLGDWERIARTVSSKQEKSSPMNKILKFYSKNRITNWRNENIGHGALSFDSDPEFTKDISDKILAIHQLLVGIESNLSSLNFQFDSESQRKSLDGEEVNDIAEEGIIFCNDVSLSPLIILRDKKVFLFDSFLSRSRASMYVDYPSGSKIKINSLELNKVFDTLEYENMSLTLSDQSVEESYLACEESALKKIDSKNDYIVPTLVVSEIQKLFNQHEKGVFLLQMERGTGKTSFSRALDALDWGHIKFDDFTQRAYYINDTYLSTADAFVVEVKDSMRCDDAGRIAIKGKFPDLVKGSPTASYDFAQVLNKYREAYEKHFGCSKLLFVFDGIDELTSHDQDIADFIPNADLLDEGVYVLLTSRTDKEITTETKTILESVSPDKTIVVYKDSELITDVFAGYLKKHFKIQSNDTLLEGIKELCDNRIVYLKVLKDLHACEYIDFKLENVPSHDELLHFYFKAIGSFYDQSSLNNIKRLLLLIAIAEEPLDIYDIAFLMNDNAVSFRLLSYVSDLRGFLRIERSREQNKFLVSNKKISELVEQEFEKDINSLVVEWLESLSSLQCYDLSNSGLLYLAANISVLARKFNIEKGVLMNDMDVKVLEALKDGNFNSRLKDRNIKTLSSALGQAQVNDSFDVYFQLMSLMPTTLLGKVVAERASENDKYLGKIVSGQKNLIIDELLPFYRKFSAALFGAHLYDEAIASSSFIYEKSEAVLDLVNVISFCKGGGAWGQAEKLIQTTLQNSFDDEHSDNKAYLNYVVGRLYIDQIDKFEEAKGFLNDSISLFSESSPYHADMVRNSLAMYWLMKGESQEAFGILDGIYTKYINDDRLNDLMKEAIACNYNIAKELCEKSCGTLDSIEFFNPEVKAYYLNNLAIAEHLYGNQSVAIEFLNDAEDISRKAGKNYALAAVLNNKYCVTSNEEALKEAEGLCSANGYSVGLEYVNHNIDAKTKSNDMFLLDQSQHCLWFCVKNVDLVWEAS